MRKENLVRTKTIPVFDLSKLTIGNAYLYTDVANDSESVTFQGILLQKHEEYLVFAIPDSSAFNKYRTFVEEHVEGCSIVRLPARFLDDKFTLEEMTIRKQGKWEKEGGFVACPCCPSVYKIKTFQELTAFGDKAPRYCAHCGTELWRETDETDNKREVIDVATF